MKYLKKNNIDGKVIKDKVQNLLEHYQKGEIDVTLVAGLLYHLNEIDNEKAIHDALFISSYGVIIDTLMVSENGNHSKCLSVLNGIVVEGFKYFEHEASTDAVSIEARERCSYQEEGAERYPSFIMTEDSLSRLAMSLGAKAVYKKKYNPEVSECPSRPVHEFYSDGKPWTGMMINYRFMLLLVKGVDQQVEKGVFEDCVTREPNTLLEKIKAVIVGEVARCKNIDEMNQLFYSLLPQLPPSLYGILLNSFMKSEFINLDFLIGLRAIVCRYIEINNLRSFGNDEIALVLEDYFEKIQEFSVEYYESIRSTIFYQLESHIFCSPSLKQLFKNINEPFEKSYFVEVK